MTPTVQIAHFGYVLGLPEHAPSGLPYSTWFAPNLSWAFFVESG